MATPIVIAITALVASTIALPYPSESTIYDYPFPFVSKEEWGAREPTHITPQNGPVGFVVIHHTYIPGICLTREACEASMRSMQLTHQITNEWSDIGYNFAVGGEGSVYEGRGWNVIGAHAVGYNTNGVGIALIGDFVSTLPPQVQLDSAKALIAAGIELGYISPNYQLIGHRQATATECPGEALFNEITSWDKFASNL